MKYSIEKKNSSIKKIYFSYDIVGLDIKAKGKKMSINAKKIVLTDPKLIDLYIKERIDKKIHKLLFLLSIILQSDDSTDGDVIMALGEMQRLKSIIINKYKQFLIEEEYKDFLRRIILLEEEFKNNYNSKLFYKDFINHMNQNEEFQR